MLAAVTPRSVQCNATHMSRDGGAPARRPSFAPPRRQAPSRSGFPEQPRYEAPAAAAPSTLDLGSYRGRSFLDQPDNVKDFATLQSMMEEIQSNIALRQDTISLLTGEVSRLQSQMNATKSMESAMPVSNGRAPAAAALPSAFPAPSFSVPAPAAGLPSVFGDDSKKNVGLYGLSVAATVFFAGVVAPVMEDKMGLGGPAYYDFIASRGLPTTMAEVDPIVASHAGGVVGIMTAQLLSGNKQRRQ